MTSSSSPPLERGLDTIILVYYLLQGHPASLPCEQFLRSHSGWFTSPLVLVEARNVLTKVYSVDPGTVTTKLIQFAAGPVVLLPLDDRTLTEALQLANAQALDLTDAVLLHQCRQVGAGFLATDDQRLAAGCTALGIAPASPLHPGLRQQVVAWELTNLRPKGLPRVLHRVHQWLGQAHPRAAQDFWSQTRGGSQLP